MLRAAMLSPLCRDVHTASDLRGESAEENILATARLMFKTCATQQRFFAWPSTHTTFAEIRHCVNASACQR